MGALLNIARSLHNQEPQEPPKESGQSEHTGPAASVAPEPSCEPVLVCWTCKGRDFWQGPGPRVWICQRCHPRPAGQKGKET